MASSEIFDRIAPGWYNFRHRSIFRPELEDMSARWKEGRLLNIGCAHGPDFVPFRGNFELYGIDFSAEMLAQARKYSQKFDFTAELALADAVHLPFRESSFDWAVSAATYHHIKEEKNRLLALEELRRVLKPGGEAFITVWNGWQSRFLFRGKEAAVSWRIQDDILYRYYYLFSYPEFERLARRAGFKVLKSFPERSYRYPLKYFSRNICLLLRKPD